MMRMPSSPYGLEGHEGVATHPSAEEEVSMRRFLTRSRDVFRIFLTQRETAVMTVTG